MLAFASAFMAGQELLAQSRSSDSGACAGCHPAQSRNYDLNGMNKALQRADKSDILRTNAALEFSEGLYRTSIVSDDTGSTLTVTDGFFLENTAMIESMANFRSAAAATTTSVVAARGIAGRGTGVVKAAVNAAKNRKEPSMGRLRCALLMAGGNYP
jgi:hypothetical protein